VFFDGEEAFVEWSRTDSTYGSRRMASTLKQMYGKSAFDTIDLFVLLDLIGGDQQRFLNYFPSSTNNVYQMMSQIGNFLLTNFILITVFEKI
jgi:glutaminyl-peptide cyclotransferase